VGIVDELIDSFSQLDFLIDLLEQEDTGVGSEFSAVEVDVDFFLAGTIEKALESRYTVFWSFVGEMCCNFVATCVIATFYHNDQLSTITGP